MAPQVDRAGVRDLKVVSVPDSRQKTETIMLRDDDK